MSLIITKDNIEDAQKLLNAAHRLAETVATLVDTNVWDLHQKLSDIDHRLSDYSLLLSYIEGKSNEKV